MAHFLLRWFSYEHLPKHLQGISKAFAFLAEGIDQFSPEGDQKTEALRKLLESKDCAVRAVLEATDTAPEEGPR